MSNLINNWNKIIFGGFKNLTDSFNDSAQRFNPAFFNKDNTFTDWATRKLPQDVRRRGVIEGIHDLSNPILTHPKIKPYAEPMVSRARTWATRLPARGAGTVAKTVLGLPNIQPRLNYSIHDTSRYETYPQRASFVSRTAPKITYEPYNNQPYGGYYSHGRDEIRVVDYPNRIMKALTETRVIPHELGHREYTHGLRAFEPLSQNPVWQPLNPTVNLERSIYRNPGVLQETRNQILRYPNLYQPSDLNQELYANTAQRRSMKSRIIKDTYF